MKLVMTGIDYKRSNLSVREKFAITKDMAAKILASFKDCGAGSCVIISTCNRTELYASMPSGSSLQLSKALCAALGMDFFEYGYCFTEREGELAMEHLCRVASGMDSQIMGDDQIITQVREAVEFSRSKNCADSYMETMFNMSIHAAKAIKTKVLANSLGTSSVPAKTVAKIKLMCNPAGKNALVIGNGRIGRMVAELLICENMNVTVTMRSHKKGAVQIPERVSTINYDERYKAMENADILVSATASPHLTLCKNEMIMLKRVPKIIVDLAVPRDVEPSIKNLLGITLLTIDDISGDARHLPPESISMANSIIAEHILKYNQWLSFKNNKASMFFPMFVDMSGKKALVVGGGNVAERRVKILASFGASITVISPEATEYIERANLSLLKRKYEYGDVASMMPFLVVAATSERQANSSVTAEAKSLGIHVSVADCREECTFYFPAIAESEDYIAGLVSKRGDHSGVKQAIEKIREVL